MEATVQRRVRFNPGRKRQITLRTSIITALLLSPIMDLTIKRNSVIQAMQHHLWTVRLGLLFRTPVVEECSGIVPQIRQCSMRPSLPRWLFFLDAAGSASILGRHFFVDFRRPEKKKSRNWNQCDGWGEDVITTTPFWQIL
jgi:hypothetical protein